MKCFFPAFFTTFSEINLVCLVRFLHFEGFIQNLEAANVAHVIYYSF